MYLFLTAISYVLIESISCITLNQRFLKQKDRALTKFFSECPLHIFSLIKKNSKHGVPLVLSYAFGLIAVIFRENFYLHCHNSCLCD